MKKIVLVILLVIISIGAAWAATFYWKNLRSIGPAFREPPEDISEVINTTEMPLKLPPGFSIEIFAKDLPGARVMTFDNFGNMWVSRTSEGVVSLLEIDRESGKVNHQDDVFRDLQKPHGLAFDPDFPNVLYIAEEHQIQKIGTYSDDPGEIILELPQGGGHFTRTLGFGPDKKLYISIGSSCNVCRESNPRRAAILQHDTKTQITEIFARGLRNSVFFAWHPETQKIWATEMGRDLLGDDTPPDEINIVEEGKNYGWPICYGKNIHDTAFDKNTYIRNPCMEPFETGSHIDIPAHSAPLGLAFFPKEWSRSSTPSVGIADPRFGSAESGPEEFNGDLLVAYHGSWNRSEPTGYKIVRVKLDKQGNFEGVEDFITGWLTPDGALGRPVDIVFKGDSIYVSDDKAGVIYRVHRQ
jgi:glucose/arabinose dehydrogenase